ncbi:MAG: hypothetical protein Kilf2KO_15720 [Rhodospirillales bacterium]
MIAKHIMMTRRQAVAGLTAVPLLGGLAARAQAQEVVPLRADDRGLLPDDRTMGDRDAPAVLIEYASLSCPHCARFHTQLLPQVKSDWIDQGKLLYVYRDFPLNAPALWAAMVALCLEGDAYFGFLDILYQQQNNWLRAEDPGLALFELSQVAGFDRERFETCVGDEATFDRLVMGIEYAEATYGVNATPTLVLNGEKVSPNGYQDLSDLIAEGQGS